MNRRLRPPMPLRSPPPRRMAGLSLVELMISITIGLMILSGVAFVFVNTSSARNEVERTSRQIENGRYAVEVISDDLRLAGFYGELNVDDPAVSTPGALPADQCSLAATDWNLWIKLHVQGFNRGSGFITTTCALTDRKADTDILVIRRARTCLAGVSGCEAVATGKPYIQVSLCASEVATHKLGVEAAGFFDLKKKACGTTVADKREYLVRIYYISTNNGSGQTIPTLKRRELGLSGGSLTWVTTALVEGIEEWNVEFGIDTDSNGTPDSYKSAPTTITDWLNVVTVQIFILARNLETSPGYTDTKTYNIGMKSDGTPLTVTPGLGYRRHVYSSLVRLSNPAGRRDKP